MATRTLTLPANCPHDISTCDRCGSCARESLLRTPGVRGVRFRCEPEASQTTIELDYDPSVVTFNQIDSEIRRSGVCLATRPAEIILGVVGMVSTRSEQLIEATLAKLPGVLSVNASFASHSLRVEFDRNHCALPTIAMRLHELGFQVRSKPATPEAAPTARSTASKVRDFVIQHHKMLMAAVGALLLVIAVATKMLHGPPMIRYVAVALGFVLAGWYTAIETFHVLRQFRFDIDVLMFAAAFGAAALGHYEEGCFLLVLFAFGGAGEELAMDRARRAIEALAKLAPETATLRDANGNERLVNVKDLAVGDHVLVRPFDRVPVDGVVFSGASAIDQSPITGESVPVEKIAGSHVFAATINGQGVLVIEVGKLAGESTLAKIVDMVNEAQTTKSPTQLFTDRIEKWYVPLVLIATSCLIVLPPVIGSGAWGLWFYRAMAFLTAASPCALAIGTPAAVLSGIARAARLGVLVKGGVHLENLGRVRVVAFDKTGTLTRGRPDVTDVVALNGIGENELLALAASLEKTSTHPLATAIVGEARGRGVEIADAHEIQQVPGQGIVGTVNGRRVAVGRTEMFDGKLLAAEAASPAGHAERLSREGKSVVVVGVDDQPVGVLGLADRERENASAALLTLKRLGIARTIMLTGDKQPVAAEVARRIGVDEFHAELLPDDKLTLVGRLQQEHGPLAMVGDGVNDAPALASATVGIAMGAGGTDVAIETADVALMADDLQKLPEAIGLSRFSRRIIKQNLVIALGVISVLAPLAALGFTYLGVAVLFHEGSTVVVVLNSMRLLVYRPR
jgi:Cd2+/Zn2+-exporting ATPase